MDSVIYADRAIQASIVQNTTDWSGNYTRCFKIHNLVIVNIAVRGEPASNKVIATGLPLPAGGRGIEIYLGYPTSIGTVDPDGTLKITSPGTFDNVYIGQTVAYLTDS